VETQEFLYSAVTHLKNLSYKYNIGLSRMLAPKKRIKTISKLQNREEDFRYLKNKRWWTN